MIQIDNNQNILEIIKTCIKEKKFNFNLGQSINVDEIIEFFNNYNPEFEYKDCLIITKLTSFDKELLIDYFIDSIKIKAKKKDNISIYDLLYNNEEYLNEFLNELMNHIIANNIEHVDGLFIREYIYHSKFCKEKCKEVSHFSIATSISIYKYYKSLRVLDPCMGWGERLIGSLFSNIDEYWGFDPSSELHEKYEEIYKTIKNKTHCKTKVNMYKLAFEEEKDILKENYFDMVFTSPPFFDQEIYNNEDDQAYIKYDNQYSFNLNFIKPLIIKSINCLKSGGYLIIYYPLDFKFIDEILINNNMIRHFPLFCTQNKNKINRFLTYKKL